MRSLVLSILNIFVMRTYAKELMNSIGKEQDLMHKVVDKPIDRMQDQWLPQHATKQADLDVTTLGKPGHLAMSHQSLLPLQPQFSQPQPLFQNSPIRVQPLRLQSTWRIPQSRRFLALQPRPLFQKSPMLLQPSRMQSILGKA